LTVKSIETFRRESLALVRITASDGKTGWGQIAPYEADISAEVLHRLIARSVVGRDISEIDAINDAVIDAQLKFPWSFLCRALAGVDTALWDLYGQITGKPVAALLGGSVRPLPAYGSSMRRDISPADEATRLARLRDTFGCEAFKIRLGTPGGHNRDASPGRSEAIIPAVRKAVGPKIALFADANSCYTPDVAIAMGRRLEDANYAAYEEPCPYWELEWTQEVTRALKIDVQGGEQDNDMAQWRRMIAMRAVDIVQPDICYVGGLTRAWRVAKMAEAAGLVTKPHAANVSLVTVFTMHLLAALPKAGEVEFSIEDDAAITRQARAMFDPVLEMKDGRAVMPDGPGWGVRIKPEWLAGAERRATPAS
jgi:L-alanine-DL-glutamate epimerase-like enolase superfamily enzyme